nr:MAG TPA: hypothetical protein [Caudoviricetes sp.]
MKIGRTSYKHYSPLCAELLSHILTSCLCRLR